MRYKYTEYSPQNKRQYFIAVGVHELRAIDGALKASLNATPHMKETLQVREALKTAHKGIKEALAEAERLVDNGHRRGLVPNLLQNDTKNSMFTAEDIIDPNRSENEA